MKSNHTMTNMQIMSKYVWVRAIASVDAKLCKMEKGAQNV